MNGCKRRNASKWVSFIIISIGVGLVTLIHSLYLLLVSLRTHIGIPTQTSYRPFLNPSIPVQSNVGGLSPGVKRTYHKVSHMAFACLFHLVSHQGIGLRRNAAGHGNMVRMEPTYRWASPVPSTITSGGSLKIRGRPRGSGRKQRLAPLGCSSKGIVIRTTEAKGFVHYVSKWCSLSCNPYPVTYEGNFEILCLSGSYLVSETGAPCSRDGGLSISLCSPDGYCIGGAIGGGRLTASTLVQVVVSSFIYDSNAKEKTVTSSSNIAEKSCVSMSDDQSLIPIITSPFQIYASHSSTVALPRVGRPDIRFPETKLELKRE